MRRLALLATFSAFACNTPATERGMTGDLPPVTTATTSASAVSSGTSSATTPPAAARLKLVDAAIDSDAGSLIRAMRLEAKSEGRVLVMYVGATWCEPCRRFKAEMQAGRLDERLGKLTLLAFDADRDVDRLGSAGYSFKFVPFVALPGPDGHPADSQQATGKGGEAWRELLAKLDAWGARAAEPVERE